MIVNFHSELAALLNELLHCIRPGWVIHSTHTQASYQLIGGIIDGKTNGKESLCKSVMGKVIAAGLRLLQIFGQLSHFLLWQFQAAQISALKLGGGKSQQYPVGSPAEQWIYSAYKHGAQFFGTAGDPEIYT